MFPNELQRPSRRWADLRFGNIVYWNEPERGVHFAALEQPALFVAEVTTFFALALQRALCDIARAALEQPSLPCKRKRGGSAAVVTPIKA